MTKLATLTLMLIFPALGFSQEKQNLDEIRQQVKNYTQEAAQTVSPPNTLVELNVGKLSPFLNLSKCEGKPEVFVRNGKLTQRHVTIGVRCVQQEGWTVYLPVSIQRHAEVYVANSAIRRGHTIAASDIRLESVDLGRLHRGYFTDADKIIGKIATRHISGGNAIRPDTIDHASTIQKGEKVIISANLEGILIKMQGKAMGKGITGELIPVRNLSSNKVIEAEIVRPGVVQVRM